MKGSFSFAPPKKENQGKHSSHDIWQNLGQVLAAIRAKDPFCSCAGLYSSKIRNGSLKPFSILWTQENRLNPAGEKSWVNILPSLCLLNLPRSVRNLGSYSNTAKFCSLLHKSNFFSFSESDNNNIKKPCPDESVFGGCSVSLIDTGLYQPAGLPSLGQKTLNSSLSFLFIINHGLERWFSHVGSQPKI